MMKSAIFCVGVGPGDPELLTIKAVRILSACDVIAFPFTKEDDIRSTAYTIAKKAVPEIAEKERLPLYCPMTRDERRKKEQYELAAEKVRSHLDAGKKVAYLTLGDPMLYCSYTELGRLLAKKGYETVYINGVSSLFAAAAKLQKSIADHDEGFTVLCGSQDLSALDAPGNYVLMKSAGKMRKIKQILSEKGAAVCAVENCGMEDEKIYPSIADIPDTPGYFTVVFAKV